MAARANAGADPRAPIRRCIVSGEVYPAAELLRFTLSPQGEVVPDLAGDLPGRGMWLKPMPGAIERAARKGLFARAAGAPVTVPNDLAERTVRLLCRRCLDYLGLARRSGEAVAGRVKVAALIESGRAAVLIAANDGAADGRAKLRALAPALPLVEAFPSADLSLALGRENVVHAALASGTLARRFLAEVGRLTALEAPARQAAAMATGVR